jgi:hypothetical protein
VVSAHRVTIDPKNIGVTRDARFQDANNQDWSPCRACTLHRGSRINLYCAAIVGIEKAIKLCTAGLHQFRHTLVSFFFFISSASCRAMTALMAAIVTSSRIPASSSQLSKVDPICGFFRLMTTPLSFVVARSPNRPAPFSAFSL